MIDFEGRFHFYLLYSAINGRQCVAKSVHVELAEVTLRIKIRPCPTLRRRNGTVLIHRAGSGNVGGAHGQVPKTIQNKRKEMNLADPLATKTTKCTVRVIVGTRCLSRYVKFVMSGALC